VREKKKEARATANGERRARCAESRPRGEKRKKRKKERRKEREKRERKTGKEKRMGSRGIPRVTGDTMIMEKMAHLLY